MSEFNIVLDLIGKLKQQLENMKATEQVNDYLLDFLLVEREQHSLTFRLRVDFVINVKKQIKGVENEQR